MTPYLCFYGTEVALVHAKTESSAFRVLLKRHFPIHLDTRLPGGSVRGRLAPPSRDEVRIRPLRESDAAWIADCGNKSFVRVFNAAFPHARIKVDA